MARCQLVVVGAVALVLRPGPALAAAPDREDPDDIRVIEICSDDAPETAAAFVQATMRVLPEGKIRLRFACSRELPTGAEASVATFVAEKDGISLQLVSGTREQSTHRVPWLSDVHRPLARTLAQGKATTAGLLLESLASDLQAMRLRPLPVLPSPDRPTSTPLPPAGPVPPPPPIVETAAPTTRAGPVVPAPSPDRVVEPREPTTTPSVARADLPPATPGATPDGGRGPPATLPSAAPPATGSPAKEAVAPASEAEPAKVHPAPAAVASILSTSASAGRQRRLEIALPLAGIDWMPPSTIAPHIEAGFGWGGPRWWVIAQGLLQLDSSFAIDWRTFHTAGYGVRLGGRRTLFRSERFRWDADATLVGHLSQYRRDGIANAETHEWFDLGVGLHSRAVLSLARHTSALVSLGGQVFPTARQAAIANGPSRRINLVTLTAVVGLCFAF